MSAVTVIINIFFGGGSPTVARALFRINPHAVLEFHAGLLEGLTMSKQYTAVTV